MDLEIEKVKKLAKGKDDKEKLELYKTYKKSKALAIILSFLFPGLGQIYLGKLDKAILMIVLAIVGLILSKVKVGLILSKICIGIFIYIGVRIWSILDAYKTAKLHNLELYEAIFEENSEE